jgi:hypothetical protein
VQPGDSAGIAGFIIAGNAPKQVLLRGLGPSLGIGAAALADPVLELHGAPGFMTIINDNWRDFVPPIPPTITPLNDLESEILVTLDPGLYTTVLRGQNNSSGIALVEVYDLSDTVDSTLANISTRAFVSTGNDIVIAGFILGNGPGAGTVAVRGLGPSLTGAGVTNPLADPVLQLRDSNGAIVDGNNDWQDNPTTAAQLISFGLAPANNLESALVTTLAPGAYTALLMGTNGGTGIGLVELYDNPSGAP